MGGSDAPQDGSTWIADVRVFGASGEVIAELLGVRLRRIGPDALLADRDDVGRRVASGIYFARIETAHGAGVVRLVLLK